MGRIRGDSIPPISDYAHWNEDAERMWYEENKYDMQHWDEPMDDYDPYDDGGFYDRPLLDPDKCSHGDTHTEDFLIVCDNCESELGIGCGAMVDRAWTMGGKPWISHEMCMIPPFPHESDEGRKAWNIEDHDYEPVGVYTR